jgi:5-methylcytosine-specific restriction endonuclease McrA
MFKVQDPRTGEEALIGDHKGYRADMDAARPPPCTHARTELRRWTNVNGAIVVQAQCLACGIRDGNQVKVHDRLAYPPADPTLFPAWQAKERAAIDSVRIRHIDLTAKQQDRQSAFYDVYIGSDAWRAKRAKVLKRCRGICEGCDDAKATQVHHLTYDHLGDELLFELVGLCDACHKKAHASQHETPEDEPEIDWPDLELHWSELEELDF